MGKLEDPQVINSERGAKSAFDVKRNHHGTQAGLRVTRYGAVCTLACHTAHGTPPIFYHCDGPNISPDHGPCLALNNIIVLFFLQQTSFTTELEPKTTYRSFLHIVALFTLRQFEFECPELCQDMI